MQGGSCKDANTLVSKQGFISLKFETGLNKWGDFEILRYTLK